jgi:glycine oxidase
VKTYDVVIVGGGIIGGSIAFDLAQRSLRVALLDRQEPMHEASWAAAGMLSPAPHHPTDIPLVPLAQASLELFPKFTETVEEASGVRTGYRTGGAMIVMSHGEAERELSTLVALHHGLGLSCEPLPLDEAIKMEPALGREARAAALLPDECSIEPRALGAAVFAAAASAGVELRAGVEVVSLDRKSTRLNSSH